MALRSYSVLYILLPTIIFIIQECSQALGICKCSLSLYCGGVPNMLLVLSITFHFHSYIWGSMCSTGPFQFRWLRGYYIAHLIIITKSEISTLPIIIFSVAVCLRCVLHHILLLITYTFRETGILFSLLLCSLWWVQIFGYVLACRSCSFVCT